MSEALDRLLQARCTEAEHATAERLAGNRGLSVAQLIRTLVREADQKEDALAALLAEQRVATGLLRELVRLTNGEPTP